MTHTPAPDQSPTQDAERLRTCIASGLRKPKDEMLRFVVGPDAAAVPDLEARLPGRGLWLSAERDVIHTACVRNLFARQARRQVSVDAGLAERVEGLLVKRCVELLQLARRAGIVTIGFDEVRQRLISGARGLVVSAVDGSPEGRRKIAELASPLPVLAALSGHELGLVMDRERIVHAMVKPGGLADRLARDMRRLSGLRPAAG